MKQKRIDLSSKEITNKITANQEYKSLLAKSFPNKKKN
jgi:hypothetical protein